VDRVKQFLLVEAPSIVTIVEHLWAEQRKANQHAVDIDELEIVS
jgi:hypothetical protein